MKKLVSLCKSRTISVKIQKKDPKGWSVSLTDVKPDFFELIGETSRSNESDIVSQSDDNQSDSVPQAGLHCQGDVITGTVCIVKEIDHYQAQTNSY